ncbi:MAG: 30S ribosomal protein S21 [Myxococcota bacterium]|nr:30S ribosomal protein S21 [Myxococcota bacterium]
MSEEEVLNTTATGPEASQETQRTTPAVQVPAENREHAPAQRGSDFNSDVDADRKKRRKSRGLGEPVFCRPLEVVVRDDRVEQAIRQLKNRMAREGVLRELKNRRHYFKPSELKRIKSREAARRRRKQARQKSGF